MRTVTCNIVGDITVNDLKSAYRSVYRRGYRSIRYFKFLNNVKNVDHLSRFGNVTLEGDSLSFECEVGIDQPIVSGLLILLNDYDKALSVLPSYYDSVIQSSLTGLVDFNNIQLSSKIRLKINDLESLRSILSSLSKNKNNLFGDDKCIAIYEFLKELSEVGNITEYRDTGFIPSFGVGVRVEGDSEIPSVKDGVNLVVDELVKSAKFDSEVHSDIIECVAYLWSVKWSVDFANEVIRKAEEFFNENKDFLLYPRREVLIKYIDGLRKDLKSVRVGYGYVPLYRCIIPKLSQRVSYSEIPTKELPKYGIRFNPPHLDEVYEELMAFRHCSIVKELSKVVKRAINIREKQKGVISEELDERVKVRV